MIKNDLIGTYKSINGVPLHDLYHLNSELNRINCYSFALDIHRATTNSEFQDKSSEIKKMYANKESIELPLPDNKLTNESIFETIAKRRSIRNFANQAFTKVEFSTLLHFSTGLTGEYAEINGKTRKDLFAYPSAGGLMPLRSYIIINNVTGIERGIYYYDPVNHILRKLKSFATSDEHTLFSMDKRLTQKASFIVYIIGTLDLTGYKYSDRGYRFMLLEAGHLAQNYYLTATALGAGAVTSGGFLDYEIKKELNLMDNYVLYEVIIGKPNTEAIDCRFVSEYL